MFICALCLYTILCKANFVDGYTQIIPQTPVIKRGSSITLSCILDNNTLLNTNVSQVFWRLNNSLISREHYTIVNESVCRVTIHNITDANVRVICGIIPQNQVLHRIYLQTGFPPEPPQNITCVYYNNANFTCTWNSGKDTNLPTNFTLIRRGPFGESVCKTSKHSCSFYFNLNLTYKYEVQVTAENALGKAATDVVSMDSKKLVKMEPPEIDFEESLPSHETSLTITWMRPLLAPDVLSVKCTLRYREKKSKQWLYQPNLQMQKNDKMVYNITGLLPFTEYATSLQCIGGDGQFLWSEWSAEKSARTAEQAPSYKVDLWRVLSSTNGHRTVHLKWKETNNFFFGVTLGYKVKWFPEHNEALQRIETTTENEITFNVSEKAYVILVKAYNSAGLSPEARLKIPAIAEKTQKIIDYTQILKKNETVTLKWNTTGSRAHRFVVDWYIDSENEPCNISWEYVENVTEWTAQQGIFEPYRCYNISIYPFVKERVESPSHIQVYFKERAPAHGPNLKTERLRKTEVTLNWEAIPKEERNGFIMNYTIIYKPMNGINGRQCDVTVDSDTYEYTLRSLMPNTQYTAYIIACNQAGNASGNPINFSTLKYDKGDVGVLIVPVGICIFLMLLLLLATCARRNQRLRRFCWPDVPNPAESTMADWPSDWPQIHLEIFEVESDGLVELACIYTSDPVYINEKATLLKDSDEKNLKKAPLKNMHFSSNTWIYKDQQTKTSSGSSPIQHAAHHSCQLTDLFGIIETPTQSSPEDRRPLLCDLCTDGHEKLENLELHESFEEIAFKPYLKNSVKTGENQAYGNNSGTCNGTVSQLVDEQKDLGQVYVTIDALQHNVKS